MDTSEPSNSGQDQIRLSLLEGECSVSKLKADFQPHQPTTGILSVTVTERETSVVCLRREEPEGANIEAGWRALYVNGPIPFAPTDVVAGITSAVASALPGICDLHLRQRPAFLQQGTLSEGLNALKAGGYSIDGMP